MATGLANAAITRRLLVPQPCEGCGTIKTEAHHDDYDKPLEVRWLCQPCHMAHHHPLRPDAPPLPDLAVVVPPLIPVPRRELQAIAYIAHYDTTRQAAKAMGLSVATVRAYIKNAAEKIPGDLPPMARLRAWYRGADLKTLGAE